METYNALMNRLTENGIHPGWFWAVFIPTVAALVRGYYAEVRWAISAILWCADTRFGYTTWTAWRERIGLQRLAREEAEENRLIALVEKRLSEKRGGTTSGTTSSNATLVKIDAQEETGQRWQCTHCKRIGTTEEMRDHNVPMTGVGCKYSQPDVRHWQKVEVGDKKCPTCGYTGSNREHIVPGSIITCCNKSLGG